MIIRYPVFSINECCDAKETQKHCNDRYSVFVSVKKISLAGDRHFHYFSLFIQRHAGKMVAGSMIHLNRIFEC